MVLLYAFVLRSLPKAALNLPVAQIFVILIKVEKKTAKQNKAVIQKENVYHVVLRLGAALYKKRGEIFVKMK